MTRERLDSLLRSKSGLRFLSGEAVELRMETAGGSHEWVPATVRSDEAKLGPVSPEDTWNGAMA